TPARLEQVHGLLSAEQMAFLNKLQEKNPVIVYAFGGKLDEDFKELKKGGKQWTTAELTAWLKMDLKEWVLDGVSPEGQTLLQKTESWDAGKPGSAEWATEWLRVGTIPEKLSASDKEIVASKREKLPRKIEPRQTVLTSTNYGDAVMAALTRESTNMLAGIIVIGDGQSNQGSPSSYDMLRQRALNMKVPI